MHRPGSRAKSRRLHSIVARVKLGRIFLSVNYLGGVEEPYSHCSIVHHATTMFTKNSFSFSHCDLLFCDMWCYYRFPERSLCRKYFAKLPAGNNNGHFRKRKAYFWLKQRCRVGKSIHFARDHAGEKSMGGNTKATREPAEKS